MQRSSKQISTLLYFMGGTPKIYCYLLVRRRMNAKTKFDGSFKVRKNLTFKHAMLNRRCQQEVESVDQFITNLYSLSDLCDWSDRHNDMIRDRIVVGIHAYLSNFK